MTIQNDATKAGQIAGSKEYFGEIDSPNRFAIYPVYTRFDAVSWIVADAETIDEKTGLAAIVRQEPTKSAAMAGLVSFPILRDQKGRETVRRAAGLENVGDFLSFDNSDGAAFEVSLWMSKPGTNDDCVTAWEVASEADGIQDVRAAIDGGLTIGRYEVGPGDHMALSVPAGPGRRRIVYADAIPGRRTDADDDDESRNEHRMQSAMAFGVEGWNDN